MTWRGLCGAALSLLLLSDAAFAEPPVKVVATFSVLGDMVRIVGEGHVSLTTLVGPDSDTHLCEPTPADAKAVADATLVVANGLGLEEWLTRLLATAGFRGRLAIASEGVIPLMEEAAGQQARSADPHAWQDLRNGRTYVANIVKALASIDPAHADDYRRAGDDYRAQLAELDKRVRAELAAIPRSKRRVITTHDAFRYYGEAYGVTFLAPLAISTNTEPSAGGMAQLIGQIKRDGIKALFLENITSARLVERIAKETGAEIGPPLYSDALSRPDEPASTYIKMFEYNTTALKAGMLKN